MEAFHRGYFRLLALAADWPQFATPLVGLVGDLFGLDDLIDVLNVEAVVRIIVALHHQHLLEALMVARAIEGGAVAQTIAWSFSSAYAEQHFSTARWLLDG